MQPVIQSILTAYAKGFPLDEELNDIIIFLEPHGPIESCQRRGNKDHSFKGSCFIIFKEKDACKKFIETESIKYKDIELVRKWQLDYLAMKKKEYEENIKSKKNKKQAQLDQKCKQLEYPKGAVIHFTGIPEGTSLTREEIKEKIQSVDEGITVAYIDFSKGDLEGHVRLANENSSAELLKKVEGDELEVSEVKLKLRALEGEEEEKYLKQTAEAVTRMREKAKLSSKNRKRKGGHFNGGKGAKSRRHND